MYLPIWAPRARAATSSFVLVQFCCVNTTAPNGVQANTIASSFSVRGLYPSAAGSHLETIVLVRAEE